MKIMYTFNVEKYIKLKLNKISFDNIENNEKIVHSM